jgi:hypothetical protein
MNFLSKASPEYEQKIVLVHKVSQRLILLGKLVMCNPMQNTPLLQRFGGVIQMENSKHLSSMVGNSMIIYPCLSIDKKASCFSSVNPVIGWNQ